MSVHAAIRELSQLTIKQLDESKDAAIKTTTTTPSMAMKIPTMGQFECEEEELCKNEKPCRLFYTQLSSPAPSTSPSAFTMSRSRSRSTSPQPRTRVSVSASTTSPTPIMLGSDISSSPSASPKPYFASSRYQRPTARYAPNSSYQSFRVDADGNTPMILSASAGTFVAVEQALAAGAAAVIDEQNFKGETALFASCVSRRAITAELLLSRGGADPNVCNAEGVSPLHVAASLDSERIVRALLKAGADVFARDEEGDTALHWAVREGAARAARSLVDFAGPELILCKNEDGESASDLAAEVGDAAASSWLSLALNSRHNSSMN